MKKVIIVVSAPRVGSSCLSGCLTICGASLGKSKADVKDKFNRKGYFENYEIMDFNRKTLASFGVDIFSLYPSVAFNEKICNSLLRLMKVQFASGNIFVMKDPRILLLWPIYEHVLSRIFTEIVTVTIKREVESYLKSTEKFLGLSGKDRTYRSNLYKMYYEIGDKLPYPSVLIWFEDLIDAPIETMKKVCDKVGLSIRPKAVKKFVDSGLKHW